MAQGTPRSHLPTEADSSLLLVPGLVLGTYVLTRLPLGVLTGLVLGFAAGWIMRDEQGEGGARRIGRRQDWLSEHEPQSSGTMSADTKVDDMSEDSFPASDAPSYTTRRTGKPSGG